MTTTFLKLEHTANDIRAIFVAQGDHGRYVVDIFYAHVDDADAFWSAINDAHPDSYVLDADCLWTVEALRGEKPDALTLREAAEAAYPRPTA